MIIPMIVDDLIIPMFEGIIKYTSSSQNIHIGSDSNIRIYNAIGPYNVYEVRH